MSPDQVYSLVDARTAAVMEGQAKTHAMLTDAIWWLQFLSSAICVMSVILVIKILIHIAIAVKTLSTNGRVVKLLKLAEAHGLLSDLAKKKTTEAADRMEDATKKATEVVAEVKGLLSNGSGGHVVPHGPPKPCA